MPGPSISEVWTLQHSARQAPHRFQSPRLGPWVARWRGQRQSRGRSCGRSWSTEVFVKSWVIRSAWSDGSELWLIILSTIVLFPFTQLIMHKSQKWFMNIYEYVEGKMYRKPLELVVKQGYPISNVDFPISQTMNKDSAVILWWPVAPGYGRDMILCNE